MFFFCWTIHSWLNTQANVHSLMGSETQVVQLLELLEAAEAEAVGIERELDDYEAMLHRARIAMATVGEKKVSLETANRKNRLLLDEMSHLVVSFLFGPLHYNISKIFLVHCICQISVIGVSFNFLCRYPIFS